MKCGLPRFLLNLLKIFFSFQDTAKQGGGLMAGHVYILSNPSMPGIYKIGSTKHHPAERARDLSSHTGVPTPFKVEYYLYANAYQQIEQAAHGELYQYKQGKEFFAWDLKNCIITVKTLAAQRGQYNEWFSSQQIKSQVEGWEHQYIADKQRSEREAAEKKRREEVKIEQERQKQAIENKQDMMGCLGIIIGGIISVWIARETHSSDWTWIWAICTAGYCIYFFTRK